MRWIAILVLTAPALAAARPGLSAEAQAGAILRADPEGSAFTPGIAGGLRAGADVARGQLLEARIELLWLHAGRAGGTEGVRVEPTADAFFLAARGGLRASASLVPYVVAGPVLTRLAATYLVHDPVAGTRDEASPAGLAWGAGYGAGLALQTIEADPPSFVGRLELARLHRGASADLFVQLGAGLRF